MRPLLLVLLEEEYGKNIMTIELEDGTMDERGVDLYWADFDYVASLGMEMKEGRAFSREFSTDSTLAALINEAMVKRMGWTEPIGKKIRLENGSSDSIPFMKIIGVVKDYHHQSLYEPISAMVILPGFNNFRGHIKVKGENISTTLKEIENTWTTVYPNTPFEYAFVDESFQEQYAEDQKRGRIFLIFSLLTIFIACLGLLGLAAYTTVLRTKEISIRRVVGAETKDILGLFTKEYLLVNCLSSYSWIPNRMVCDEKLAGKLCLPHLHELPSVYPSLSVDRDHYGMYDRIFALRAANSNPADALKAE